MQLLHELEQEIASTQEIMQDRKERVATGVHDFTDVATSDRMNQLDIELNRTKIEILKNGGFSEFPVLRDIDTGEIVSHKLVNGKFGPVWIIKDEHQAKFGKFVGDAKRESTFTRKGLKSGMALLPAWAKIRSNGSGMYGVYTGEVYVFPSNKNYATES